jgi:hypothetical protein
MCVIDQLGCLKGHFPPSSYVTLHPISKATREREREMERERDWNGKEEGNGEREREKADMKVLRQVSFSFS